MGTASSFCRSHLRPPRSGVSRPYGHTQIRSRVRRLDIQWAISLGLPRVGHQVGSQVQRHSDDRREFRPSDAPAIQPEQPHKCVRATAENTNRERAKRASGSSAGALAPVYRDPGEVNAQVSTHLWWSRSPPPAFGRGWCPHRAAPGTRPGLATLGSWSSHHSRSSTASSPVRCRWRRTRSPLRLAWHSSPKS
jgi:hypothetical protein